MITVPTINPNSNLPFNTSISTSTINIATHNTRSFIDPAKQQHLISLYDTHHFDIIGLQETNIKTPLRNLHNSFPSYTSLFSSYQNSQVSGFGVGLLFSSKIAKHIFKHESKFDRVIYAKLQFADKQKLIVINCYLPTCNNSSLRKPIQQYITQLINDANANDFHIILLGDFNADIDRRSNPPYAKSFMTSLQHHGLCDVFNILYDDKRSSYPSFFRNSSHSRIDYIWTSSEITLNLTKGDTVHIMADISDHSAVMATFHNFLSIKHNKHKTPAKIAFNYNNMDDTKWSKFQQKSDAMINNCQLKQLSSNSKWNQSSLNRF
jgi:exonuclease III